MFVCGDGSNKRSQRFESITRLSRLNLLTLLKFDHFVILLLKFQWKRSRIGGTGFGNPERGVTLAISVCPIINRALRRLVQKCFVNAKKILPFHPQVESLF